MAKVIMTSKQYVERLKIVAERKTKYSNRYPDNLLYVHRDYTSGDCLNTIKALLNGYNVYNNQVGYYQRDLSNTGDINEPTLLSKCSEISSDFDSIPFASLLYMRGHVGSFVGECVRNGNTYNVIETTKAWQGGVLYSWVDPDGTRRNKKGGSKNGKWVSHGKMTMWIDYSDNQEEKPEKPVNTDYSKYPILKYGSKGDYVKTLQKLLFDKGYDCKGIDGIWGQNTDKAVRKFQAENTDVNGKKLVVDGCVGPLTWGALYK